MMIAFVYVMLSAKPVSLRRLCALFVLSTAAGATILSILHVPHSSTTAVHVASAITFTAWILPLIRILGTIRRRARLREMLSLVSIPVQLTYWVTLLLVPIVIVAELSKRVYADGVNLGAISKALTVTLIIGIPLLLMAIEVLRRRRLMNLSPLRKVTICETRGGTWHRVARAAPTRRL
jgi:hypothetical protein